MNHKSACFIPSSGILSFLLITFFCVSCEKVIDFNGRITEPMLVLNSYITPDSAVKAQVSESRFFLSNQDTFTMVSNANIVLWVNGAIEENLTYNGNGLYKGSYFPHPGDSLRLLVSVPGKPGISCGTTVQASPQVDAPDTNSVLIATHVPVIRYDSIALKQDTLGYADSHKINFVMKISDDGNVRNYYRLIVRSVTRSLGITTTSYSFSFDDVVSGNTEKGSFGPPSSLISNKFNIFSDNLFDGKVYPLSFSLMDTYGSFFPMYHKYVYITLQSLSPAYYFYLQTREAIGINSFFAEPVQVYSNVEGGTGIFGSFTGKTFRITLH